jgi:DNA-binding transcriptional LysR family regulator
LEISVHSETSSDLADDLLTADLDLALITNPARNLKLTIGKLVETPLQIVLPRERPLATKAFVRVYVTKSKTLSQAPQMNLPIGMTYGICLYLNVSTWSITRKDAVALLPRHPVVSFVL